MKVPADFGVDDDALTDVVIPSDLHHVKDPENRILEALRHWGYDADTTFAIKLAFEEAATNAAKHGNRNDHTKRIDVRYYVDAARVVIMVRDEGRGFRPENVPDPTRDENLERPSGRGIMLIQSYMTKVHYSQNGNEVWMLKENPARAGCGG